jgi:hypothetical protein
MDSGKGKVSGKGFNVDNIRVVKILGGSLGGSRVVRGMVFGREAEGGYSFIFPSGPIGQLIGYLIGYDRDRQKCKKG